MEIRNIEDLLFQFLKNGRFVSYECENLLSSGENYGSVMMKVQIKLINNKNKEEIIECVAKCTPPNEFLWTAFNTKVTFKKEIALYKTIVPTINEFGKEKGIDNIFEFFAKPLGARISLDPESDVVDKDAVLLLENLKVQGYDSIDRMQGFDMETTKLILKDLAVFHAGPIAYKLAKPKEFKAKLMPYLNRDFEFLIDKKMTDGYKAPFREAAGRNPECVPYLSKLDEGFDNLAEMGKRPMIIHEPFATIVHQDFWTNNTMIKMVDGKPAKNKMVDFQIIEYNSPAHDVIFFLYSSVEQTVLEKEINNLLKYYYDIFIDTLVRLGCDSSRFTFEALMREFQFFAKDRQFSHILIMVPAIYTIRGKAKELSDFDEKDMVVDLSVLHENFYKRLQFILLDFVKREWI